MASALLFATFMRNVLLAVLLMTPTACADESVGPPSDEHASSIRLELGQWRGLEVVGVGEAPEPETDQLPRYELFVGTRLIDDAAVEAVVDEETSTLAWVDAAGTLWLAPLDEAPVGKRAVGEAVLPALVTSGGQLAFAERVDGPETAPFVFDLRTLERTALDDGPGPDEVLGFSPAGDEVLLLSGRTGLASLFAAGVDEAGARQLTNIGLRPGPTLDRSRVTPAPADHRSVAWGPGGVAYDAGEAVIWIDRDGAVSRIEPEALPASIEELVR